MFGKSNQYLMKCYYSQLGGVWSLFGLFILFLLPLNCHCQKQGFNGNSKPIAKDSLIKRSSKEDKSFDSVIFPVDTLFQRFKKYSKKRKLLNKIFSPILVEPERQDPKKIVIQKEGRKKQKKQKPKKEFCPDSTKVLRGIYVEVFEPFGPRMNDIERPTKNWLERRANSLHHTTRDWVIKQRVLFKKGDKYDKFKITESERLIRQTGYVNDARIYIINNDYDCDSFDMVVYVFDIFSLGASADGDPINKNGNLNISDNNVYGFGQKVNGIIRYDQHKTNAPWQFNGSYYIPQIGKSFVSSNIFLNTDFYEQKFGFNFNRPMITYSIIYGGGISMSWERIHFQLIKRDSSKLIGFYYGQNFDAWLGRAFEPISWNSEKFKGIVRQLSIGARVINNHNFIRRFKKEELFKSDIFRDYTLFLGSISINKRSYYKDKYIFGFGRTEDISLGNIYSFTAGYEPGAYYNRQYIGGKYGFATQISKIGYLSFAVELGSFIKNSSLEQGALGISSLYFSDVMSIRKFKIRQFFWERYSKGYHRLEGEFLNLNSSSALRGVNSGLLGTEKLTLNAETDIYLPYNILGFKITGLIMMDYTLLKSTQSSLLRSPLYQGYGIGIRFRNEHLIFSAIQMAFFFYPNHSKLGVPNFEYNSTASSYYRFQGFDNYQPSTVGYGF